MIRWVCMNEEIGSQDDVERPSKNGDERTEPCEQATPDNLKGRWGYCDVK